MTQRDAENVLVAAKGKAAEMGRKVSIAVVDDHGDLVALIRLDGARHLTADIARGKAMVAAAFEAPSGVVAKDAVGSLPHQHVNTLSQDRLFFGQGAVPVCRAQVLIGAVGVSGANSEEDEEIASAGAAAIEA